MYLLRTFVICCLLAASLLINTIAAEESANSPENRSVMLEQYRELVKAGAESASDPELQKQYLNSVIALGYYDLAAEQYEKMLATTPGDTTLLCALGEAWMNVGPYGVPKAFETLEKALQIDGNSVDALMALAHLYHKEGLYPQAEKYYDEVLTRVPVHVRARLGKAVLLVRSGDITAASEILDNARMMMGRTTAKQNSMNNGFSC